MKKSIFIVAVLALCSAALCQNVSVSGATGQNIESFINNELVGSGVYIFNARFNGQSGIINAQSPQIGTFQSNGFAGLSMNDGVIITTGGISLAAGPNNNTSGNASASSTYTDPQMQSLGITNMATSCATIDFDFVCLSNSVSFQYCFGSEEYNEFVYSTYNDVFVFMLTGPDPITGATVTRNIAMIPGTDDADHPYGIPVSINSVNSGQSSSYYSMPCDGCYDQYTMYYNDNDHCNSYYDTCTNEGVQYDGYTTKLSATGSIVPCEQYHMHISVCNVSDNLYDSGVFLEGHSLNSPGVEMGLGRAGVDTVRRSSPLTLPLAMSTPGFDHANVRISYGGDAINGIDFFLTTSDGTVLNSGESIDVTTATTYLTLQPLSSANLSTPKSLDIYFASALCDDFPELLIHDTMHFILANDATSPSDNNDIATAEANKGLFVYPNPTSSHVNISCTEPMQHVSIYDVDGREVYSIATSSASLSIDLSRLSKGIYTAQAHTASATHKARIIVE